MENNFISDFKTYCETVDSTEGLEIIKGRVLDHTLNLETFIDDYVNEEVFNNRNRVPKEAIKLAKGLQYFACEYQKILDQDIRKLYLSLEGYSMKNIEEIFFLINEDCIGLLKSKHEGYSEEYYEPLKKEHLEKWWSDLYLLLDKYDI